MTKGRIFFCTSLFFFKWLPFGKFSLRGDFFYEIVRVTSSAKAFFEVVDVFIEGFSGGVSSQESKGFALYETFSDPVRVTGRGMRVLESLCSFKMCADVKDSLVVKSPFPVLTRDWNKVLFFSGPLSSSTLKPQMRVKPLPIFGPKCKWKPIKRDKSTSRDFVARGRPLRVKTRLAPLAKRSTFTFIRGLIKEVYRLNTIPFYR